MLPPIQKHAFILLTVVVTSLANALSLPMYINAGTSPYVSTAGDTWVSDVPFVTGGKVYSDTRPNIAETDDDGLFHVERFFRHFEDPHYTISLPSGTTQVEVTLLFTENYFKAAGKRSFDIVLEGNTVATAFDIFERAGGSRIAFEFTRRVTVEDGVLDIVLPRRLQNPKINGIKVVSVQATRAPAKAPTKAPAKAPTQAPVQTPTEAPVQDSNRSTGQDSNESTGQDSNTSTGQDSNTSTGQDSNTSTGQDSNESTGQGPNNSPIGSNACWDLSSEPNPCSVQRSAVGTH